MDETTRARAHGACEVPTATGSTPQDVIERLLSAMRQELGMDVAFVAELAGGRRTFRYVDAGRGCGVAVGGSHPVEETYCGRLADGTLEVVVRDTRAHPVTSAMDITRALGIRSSVGVPLVLPDGSLYGTLCCFSHEPKEELSDRDVAFVRALASVAGQQVQFLRAFEARAAVSARVDAVLVGGDLRVVFQPICDLTDGGVVGMEALSRFPGEPPRAPDAWFRDAAAAGRLLELELLAVRRAIAQLGRVPSEAYVSLNVSPDTARTPQLAALLGTVDASRVVLELTEHAEVSDYSRLMAALAELRAAGVRIAVDDAGSGFASLAHILRLEPDVIKFDRVFTSGVDVDPARRAVASALVNLARDIGATVIAEGIETVGEAAAVHALGVRYGQGYHLGAPAPLPAARLDLPQPAPVAELAGVTTTP